VAAAPEKAAPVEKPTSAIKGVEPDAKGEDPISPVYPYIKSEKNSSSLSGGFD